MEVRLSMIATILIAWIIDCAVYSLICHLAKVDFNFGIAFIMLMAISFALLLVNDVSRE